MSKKIKISDFKPDLKNHNKHTAFGMDLLEKSVSKVGIIESITVSNDNEIISGNARHEVIGKAFDTEPIIVETDGTRPVILKRTDIQSNTKQFYEASILANTTAKKNIDIDVEVVEDLAVEYELEIEELGVDVVDYHEDTEKGDEASYNENKYPLAIILNKSNMIKWNELKEKIGLIQDTNAFIKLLETYKITEND